MSVETEQPAPLPITMLPFEDAGVMRRYAAWLETHSFERSLWCTRCREKAEASVGEGDLVIACACRMLLWKAS